MDPVEAHVAQLRHLSRASSLERILSSGHAMAGGDARQAARQAAPFVEQGLAFWEAGRASTSRVRPVLQYYAYLNLAVACVLVYRPPDWQSFRTHGAEDLSRDLKNVKLGSEVVRTRRGAITLFHSLISSGALPRGAIRLKDLMVAIPHVGSEMEHVFKIDAYELDVAAELIQLEHEGNDRLASQYSFRIVTGSGAAAKIATRFPAKRMGASMPLLRDEYDLHSKTDVSRTYISRQLWTLGNRERAERFHQDRGLKLVNYGGQHMHGNVEHCRWRFRPDTPLVPTLTAGLLLSFFLASLARYRSNVLNSVQDSRMNLLCEVFISEADGFMIPAFRNLLYGHTLYISRLDYA